MNTINMTKQEQKNADYEASQEREYELYKADQEREYEVYRDRAGREQTYKTEVKRIKNEFNWVMEFTWVMVVAVVVWTIAVNFIILLVVN